MEKQQRKLDFYRLVHDNCKIKITANSHLAQGGDSSPVPSDSPHTKVKAEGSQGQNDD